MVWLALPAAAAIAQTGEVTFVHDPCIIKSGDYYYVFSTRDQIDMRRSNDLRKWEFVGSVFNATLYPNDPNYQWIDRGKVIESN